MGHQGMAPMVGWRLHDKISMITARRVWTAAMPAGTKALAIETAEAGTIAFAVTSEVIADLRLCLDQLEQEN
jgi:hypothetical protein